jgi:hypothetical protein
MPPHAIKQLNLLYNLISGGRSFCASPSFRPQLRFGLQSLGLAQKDSLLLLMIYII